jgi:hypothetical protein
MTGSLGRIAVKAMHNPGKNDRNVRCHIDSEWRSTSLRFTAKAAMPKRYRANPRCKP